MWSANFLTQTLILGSWEVTLAESLNFPFSVLIDVSENSNIIQKCEGGAHLILQNRKVQTGAKYNFWKKSSVVFFYWCTYVLGEFLGLYFHL